MLCIKPGQICDFKPHICCKLFMCQSIETETQGASLAPKQACLCHKLIFMPTGLWTSLSLRGEHGYSSQNRTSDAPLSPDFPRPSEIHSVHLHRAIWCLDPRQMDYLLHCCQMRCHEQPYQQLTPCDLLFRPVSLRPMSGHCVQPFNWIWIHIAIFCKFFLCELLK